MTNDQTTMASDAQEDGAPVEHHAMTRMLNDEELRGWTSEAEVKGYITRCIDANGGEGFASHYDLDQIMRDAFLLNRGVFKLAVVDEAFWAIIRRNELAPSLTPAGEQAAESETSREDADAIAMSLVKELVARLAQMCVEDNREFSSYRAGYFDAGRHIVSLTMGMSDLAAGEWLAGKLTEAIDMGKSRRVSG